MENTYEVVSVIGEYTIVRLYANTLYTENGSPYCADIYSKEEDVLREHPNTEVMKGYGVIGPEGYMPDDAEDWYNTKKEVASYIESK